MAGLYDVSMRLDINQIEAIRDALQAADSSDTVNLWADFDKLAQLHVTGECPDFDIITQVDEVQE